jgi:hypothetical protein
MTESFDAVAWMRKRRAEIDQEDEGLAWDQKSKKTVDLLSSDPLWEHFSGRVCRPTTATVQRDA